MAGVDPQQPSIAVPDVVGQRLKRVFSIHIETCPHCGGMLRVIACIEEPELIARILGHVQRREELNGPNATAVCMKASTIPSWQTSMQTSDGLLFWKNSS